MAYELNNFYRDNACDINDFNVFLQIQHELFTEMTKYTDGIARNKYIGWIETYRVIPAQQIAVYDACYDISAIVSTPEIMTIMGYTPSMTIGDKIAAWNQLSSNDTLKLKALDDIGAYIEFTAVLIYPFQGTPHNPSYEVIGMDLYSDTGERFQIGSDYEILNNRLYLLTAKCAALANQKKIFIAKNIAIDYNTPARILGDNFSLPMYADLSKDVFNDILQKLVISALGGPTIKNMKAGLAAITNVASAASVYDMISAPFEKKVKWTSFELSPYDFIVEIPEEYATSDTLSDIVKRFIDTVKTSDSAYDIVLKSSFEDLYARHVVTSTTEADHVTDTNDESYKSVNTYPQTNNPEYTLNKTFTTQHRFGYGKVERCSTIITDTSTQQVVIVDY